MSVKRALSMFRGEDHVFLFSIRNGNVKTAVRDGGNGLDEIQTTITVRSTAAFTSTGAIKVDDEIIPYTGKTATTFTGCTRGGAEAQSGDFAARPHIEGSDVYQVEDVTGWTGEMDIRESAGATTAIIADKTTSVVSASLGLLSIVMASGDTSALTPDTLYFDLTRTNVGYRKVLTYGPFQLKQEGTR